MPLFLLLFFLIYGAFHLYAFHKINKAFDLRKKKISFLFFMLLMVVAPILVRLSEKAGFELFARLLSYLGYVWMGVLFLFVITAFILDLLQLVFFVCKVSRGGRRVCCTPREVFNICLVVSVGISGYGYFEALDIRTEKIEISTAKLPAEVQRLRIVQISDVHIGLIVRQERLSRILSAVKKANPDVLVSTGDLVDGQINGLDGISAMFQEIKPRYGKFAVTGNHEFYAGINQSLLFTRKSGFTILQGKIQPVSNVMNVAGVDDRVGVRMGQVKNVSEKELLSDLPQEKFTLLLKHRPVIDQESATNFDLQLSGHGHDGQIFPFNLLTNIFYPAQYGVLNSVNGSQLYVSRGSGTWGPPIRFLSPPEVTVIDLIQK